MIERQMFEGCKRDSRVASLGSVKDLEAVSTEIKVRRGGVEWRMI